MQPKKCATRLVEIDGRLRPRSRYVATSSRGTQGTVLWCFAKRISLGPADLHPLKYHRYLSRGYRRQYRRRSDHLLAELRMETLPPSGTVVTRRWRLRNGGSTTIASGLRVGGTAFRPARPLLRRRAGAFPDWFPSLGLGLPRPELGPLIAGSMAPSFHAQPNSWPRFCLRLHLRVAMTEGRATKSGRVNTS